MITTRDDFYSSLVLSYVTVHDKTLFKTTSILNLFATDSKIRLSMSHICDTQVPSIDHRHLFVTLEAESTAQCHKLMRDLSCIFLNMLWLPVGL